MVSDLIRPESDDSAKPVRTVPYSELSPTGKVRFHVEQIEETVASITFPASTGRADIRRQIDGILASLDDQSQTDFDDSFGAAVGRLMAEAAGRKVMEQFGDLESIVRDLAAATSDVDVAGAQRVARAWVSAHPVSGDQHGDA